MSKIKAKVEERSCRHVDDQHDVGRANSTRCENSEMFHPKRRRLSTEKMKDICTDGPLQDEQLSMDVYPISVCDEFEYRRKLKNVDEELVGRDIAALKFLCHKIIPASKLEKVHRGIDLFPELEMKQRLSLDNLQFLSECLLLIGRIDLLRKLGVDVDGFKEELRTHGGELSLYRKTLLEIGDGLTMKEVSTLKYLVAPQIGSSRTTKGSIETAFDLFVAFEHAQLICETDISYLTDQLREIGQPVLAEIANNFHASLEGEGIEETFLNVHPPPAPSLLPSTILAHNSQTGSEALAKPAPQSAWLPQNDDVDQSARILQIPPGCSFNSLILPPLDCVMPKPSTSSSFYYGEAAENLPNITVSSGEAQLHQPTPNTSAAGDREQNVITQDLRRLKLKQDEEDLPQYKMDSHPRGFCLIINNKNFYHDPTDEGSKELKDRKGTDVDAYNLTYIFQKLDFIVKRYDDLTETEMVRTCTEFSMIDHRSFDCFVCCILTHGVKDHLYGCNGNLVPLAEVTSCFKTQRCPSLNGKPKLFFIQACQGKEKQGGLPEFQRDAPDQQRETIPNEADFLLGYATAPGFVSYRSDIYGSWYITKLVEMVDKHADKYDLLSIMIVVNEHVGKARSMEKGVAYKQSPAPLATLRKKIFFK